MESGKKIVKISKHPKVVASNEIKRFAGKRVEMIKEIPTSLGLAVLFTHPILGNGQILKKFIIS